MSEINFPFLNNMIVEQIDPNDGQMHFYKVKGQGIVASQTNLSIDYFILAGQSLTDQTFTIAGQSAFRTNNKQLKVWVSWIDNINLQASWTVNNHKVNQVNGTTEPLTYDTSPIGSFTMPLGSVNNPTPNVSVDLINGSSTSNITGTFKVILVTYSVEEVQGTYETYTSLDYPGGGTT